MDEKRRAGMEGERQVAALLAQLPAPYRSLHDLLLATPHGTAQIDHLVVSPYRLFLIETKNLSGTLIGTDKDALWRQVRTDGSSRSLENPVRQNFGHVQTLRQLLKPYGNPPLVSILALPDTCRLEVRSRSPIVTWSALTETILSYQTETIRPARQEAILTFLAARNLTDPAARARHIRAARARDLGLNH